MARTMSPSLGVKEKKGVGFKGDIGIASGLCRDRSGHMGLGV